MQRYYVAVLFFDPGAFFRVFFVFFAVNFRRKSVRSGIVFFFLGWREFDGEIRGMVGALHMS